MRQRLSDKKIRRLRSRTGMDVVMAWIRGDSGHTIMLVLRTGTVAWLYLNGRIEIDPTDPGWEVTEATLARWPVVSTMPPARWRLAPKPHPLW